MTRATSYAAPSAGAAGLIADENPSVTITRMVETAAGAGFGIMCGRGTDRNKQATIGGSVPLGVVCRTQYTESVSESVALYEEAKLLRMGMVYLGLADAGNAGSALCYNTTTGVFSCGSPGAGEIAVPGETMEDAAGSGAVALCWIDLTYPTAEEVRLAACELAVGTTLPAVDTAFQALFTGAGIAVGISPILVKFASVDMKADESEITAALPGTAASKFVALGMFARCKTASGTPDGDGTINIGTSTGGTQIASAAACTGIVALGASKHNAFSTAVAAAVAGNATLYCNVEAPDGDAGTCVYDVYLYGYQVGA